MAAKKLQQLLVFPLQIGLGHRSVHLAAQREIALHHTPVDGVVSESGVSEAPVALVGSDRRAAGDDRCQLACVIRAAAQGADRRRRQSLRIQKYWCPG
jgi:hypothetical protein